MSETVSWVCRYYSHALWRGNAMARQKRGVCIYCPEKGEQSLSREDVMLRGFGRFQGTERLANRVCAKCNNGFTDIDEILIRDYSLPLELLGVTGRSGEERDNYFRSGFHGRPRRTLVGRASAGEAAFLEPIRGDGMVRYQSQARIEPADGEPWRRPLVSDRDFDDLRTYLTDAKSRGMRLRRVTFQVDGYDDAEAEGFQRRISEIWDELYPHAPMEWDEPRDDRYPMETAHVIELSVRDCRAIAKICFHYLLQQFQDVINGMEPEFAAIREFLATGENHAQFLAHQFDMEQNSISLDGDSVAHILTARSRPRSVLVRMQLFSGIEGLPNVVFGVWAADRTQGTTFPSRVCGHRYEYFECPPRRFGTSEYDGECVEMPERNIPAPGIALP